MVNIFSVLRTSFADCRLENGKWKIPEIYECIFANKSLTYIFMLSAFARSSLFAVPDKQIQHV